MSSEKSGTLFKEEAFENKGSYGFQTSNKSSMGILKECEEVPTGQNEWVFLVTVFCRYGDWLVPLTLAKAGRFSRFFGRS
ncbi:hypothetical protein LOY67_07455 [Pseudomonas sp. B21-056]|jgi:hypothetical protein|uniref:hypothetical protein n=1 Tax=Pseudomonas sp. B21-056 TaxID=2895495 RepID=UPI00222E5014|nr:hypothetical protein [Pseudomonas sp. B21-056]UZE25233.1 hypothetical protein LOY67_07455 [Pseudomonas sp. B21-056]